MKKNRLSFYIVSNAILISLSVILFGLMLMRYEFQIAPALTFGIIGVANAVLLTQNLREYRQYK